MAKNNHVSTDDLDDGTWHQPAQTDPTPSPEDPTPANSADTGSADGEQVRSHYTVPVPDSTPPLHATSASKESADSDEGTPRLGTQRSEEWNRLPAPKLEIGSVI